MTYSAEPFRPNIPPFPVPLFGPCGAADRSFVPTKERSAALRSGAEGVFTGDPPAKSAATEREVMRIRDGRSAPSDVLGEYGLYTSFSVILSGASPRAQSKDLDSDVHVCLPAPTFSKHYSLVKFTIDTTNCPFDARSRYFIVFKNYV